MKKNLAGILSGIIITAALFASSCSTYSTDDMDYTGETFSSLFVKSIDCSLISESVEITEADVDKIEVDLYTSPYYKYDLHATNESGTLKIYATNSGKNKFFSNKMEKGLVYVRIPKNKSFYSCNITIDTGKITVKDIKAETLSISSDAGSMAVTNTVSETCTIKNEGGSVELIDAAGKLTANTSAGSINVKYNKPIANDADITATTGSIKLSLNKDSSFEATCTTSLGKVKCDKFSRSESKIYNGSGLYKISLRTTVGLITVE